MTNSKLNAQSTQFSKYSTLPGSGVEGEMIWYTTGKIHYYWNGTTWRPF